MSGPQPLTSDDLQAKLDSFDSIPLFMRSLPDDHPVENSTLAALQSLAHEGTPDEIAENFKEQGNDYFKGKRYRDAIGFYTQGIDAKPDNSSLLEALLCNRAACNLALKNYGSVLRDCSKALSLNPKSLKAYYRSAMALVALDRLEEAIDCCTRCLEFDKDNKGVLGVLEHAAKSKATKDKVDLERKEKLRQELLAKAKLDNAFKERNIFVLPKADGSQNPYVPRFDPEDFSGNTLIFPVFFLYPQYATSDVIPGYVEDTPFFTHLEIMFNPAPEWDTKRQYKAENLVVYAITRRKRLLKVGKKMSLRNVFNASKGKEGDPPDGLELKDNCLTFVVLPKGEVDIKWVWRKRLDWMLRKWMYSLELRMLIRNLVSLGPLKMSVNHKILRTANAPPTPPDEMEISVAQAIIDLENNVPDLKTDLRPLQISAAREVDVRGGKKAIVIFVPVPQLKAFHKVQQRLTRELEKKFSDRHVVFVAQRRMLRKPTRNSRVQQKRPRSRTLTNVHEKILEDLVFPTEIVGKRTRVAVDGSKLLKVFLDSKDANVLEYKLDSFSSVYRRLTGKDVVFEFPVVVQE
ncbi:40S ribosomal protein S7 [Lentinula edodes]|uniref:40S ribosomal protein S7 n=1 Tax=Lentinula edodes TaxID=5353 RepID=UPI001E8D56A8|nr:40S ribosomal protein S7 [Lentinula edodes]KAH7868991.1 40S ribosomal protein S7 [Lentinula edodes]